MGACEGREILDGEGEEDGCVQECLAELLHELNPQYRQSGRGLSCRR